MKRLIIGYVKEVSHGTVEVIVSEDATEKQIKKAILEAEDEGNVVWASRKVGVHGWEEDPNYSCPEELEEDK